MSTKNKQKDSISPMAFYWRELLGGKYLTSGWLRRNIPYMILLFGMTLFYISNRYMCQQALIKNRQLSDTLLDRRYKALTVRSQLQEITLRSNVEEHLTDSTLKTSADPAFYIPN